ncbi:Crp/Fnr family transcriptional regulator [Terriglobus roseus]|nr:Crp/Fnr family transcriptional regulator [Terriglobus roseus]
MVLQHRGSAATSHVFLASGLASMAVMLANGVVADVATFGSESMTGLATLLGQDTGNADCVVRIEGEGLRVPSRHLAELFRCSPEFRACILQLTQRQMSITAQICACNLHHQALSRLVRWLLTTADLTKSSSIPLTQDALAEMLGIGRPTVSLLLQPLFESGVVRGRRGTIQIIDRKGLLPLACECYDLVHRWTYPPAQNAAQQPLPDALWSQEAGKGLPRPHRSEIGVAEKPNCVVKDVFASSAPVAARANPLHA